MSGAGLTLIAAGVMGLLVLAAVWRWRHSGRGSRHVASSTSLGFPEVQVPAVTTPLPGGPLNIAAELLRMPRGSPLSSTVHEFETDDVGALIIWRGNQSELFPFQDKHGRRFVARFPAYSNRMIQRDRYAAIEALDGQRKRELGLVSTQVLSPAIGSSASAVSLDAVIMARVPGVSITQYIVEKGGDALALWRLAENLRSRFHAFNVSRLPGWTYFGHGDLSSENTLVTEDGSVWFVDYDDVYLPQLSPGTGIGNSAYQHPARDGSSWGPYMDTFSAVLIYGSVRAIAADRRLLDMVADTSILFTQYDLENPGATELWRRLALVADRPAQRAFAQIMKWCGADTPPDEPFAAQDFEAWGP